MTDEQIKRLRELEAKATKGPWEPCGCRFSIVTAQITPQETMDICDTKINDAISCEQAEANNCFIAAARSAVPELLDEIAMLKQDNAAQECLLAEAVTGAEQTEDEMMRLRNMCWGLETNIRSLIKHNEKIMANERAALARVAALEKVREAAEGVSLKYDPCCGNPRWDKLSEALDEAALNAARGE